MTTILPAERSSWDVIGKQIGANLNQHLPGAVQQGYQRQQGLNAIDELQTALQASGGDINKMLPAIAKAYTLNPALERSGIAEQALRKARVNQIFPPPGQETNNPNSFSGNNPNPQGSSSQDQTPFNFNPNQPNPPSSEYGIIPRIKTVEEDRAQAEDFARRSDDPNAFDTEFNRLQTERNNAINQRNMLEKLAGEQGVSREDMPEFMEIGKNHNYMRDPNKWVLATNKDFGPYKNAKEQLRNAFVPGFFRGLISSEKDREKELNRLNEPIQELLKVNPALEPKIRQDLASEYLSQTEIEGRIHPLSDEAKKGLEKLPRGLFEHPTMTDELSFSKGFPERKTPFVSYEDALKKAPKQMQSMNSKLANYFRDNIKPDTSLLVLRDALWDKDYDWRQIADAMLEAKTGPNGIKYSPNQLGELTQLQTQAPKQSLSHVFSDWGRWIDYLRGNK